MEPKEELQSNFVLVPIGYMFNADLQQVQMGDTITFLDGGRYRVLCARKMSLKDDLTACLCIMRYGFSIDYWLGLWRQSVRYSGHGKSAISENECLFISYGKENIARNNRKLTRV